MSETKAFDFVAESNRENTVMAADEKEKDDNYSESPKHTEC